MTDVIYKSVDDVTIKKPSVFTLKVFFGFFKFSNTHTFVYIKQCDFTFNTDLKYFTIYI